MSVALDLSLDLDVDALAGPGSVPSRRPRLRVVPCAPVEFAVAPAAPLASVAVLRAPSTSTVPLRLTRRGIAVLAVLTAALGAALVWAATLSAPEPAAGPSAGVPATVTVRAGDTLWALASRVAPQRDPRVEVADLRRLNHLSDPALTPGQTLRLR